MAMTVVERFYDSANWPDGNTTSYTVNAPRFWGQGTGTYGGGATGRNGGQGYSFSPGSTLTFQRETSITTPTAVIVGFALATGSGGTSPDYTRDLFTVFSGATEIVKLKLDAQARLVLSNGTGSTTYGTGAQAVAGFGTASFIYCEFSVYLNGASSKVWARRDGVDSIAETTVNLTGFTSIDDIRLGFSSAISATTTIFDDIYIHTGTGAPTATDFLGDIVIYSEVPIADVVNTGWDDIPNGSNIFAEIDNADNSSIPTSDYIYAATTGIQYTTQMSALDAAATTVIAVQVAALSGKGGFGSPAVQVRAISRDVSGGTVYNTPNAVTHTLGTTWRFVKDVYPVYPVDGTSWTKTKVDAHSFGLERL
jgi:hypothetical protein